MTFKNKPHILLITTDQQRFDANGVTGPSFLRTPHFQQLCSQGIRFDRAYADCPLCVPSRASIMTGQPAYAHGLTENGPTRETIANYRSLPTVIARQGYQTAAIGKMHFGPQRLRHGFQEMILPDDYYREMGRNGSEPQPMRHGLGQNELYPGMSTVPEAKTLTSWIAEQCVDYIRFRRDPELPFFLWCSFSKPHPPFDPPEPYYSMYRDSAIPDPVISSWCDNDQCPIAFRRFIERRGTDLMDRETIRATRAAYYGLITQIDYNMGRIFAALQESGILKDTFILYASDHGEFIGDHLSSAKSFFHEPSARVPFVMRLPQTQQKGRSGRVEKHLVTLADIYPTLLAVAGGKPDSETHGHNLLDLVESGIALRETVLAVQGPKSEPQHLSITDGQWKYMYYPEGPSEQLFDLNADPQERVDLSRDETKAPTIQHLRSLIRDELQTNAPDYLHQGQLPVREPLNDTLEDRRRSDFPGYSTEYKDKDTRH